MSTKNLSRTVLEGGRFNHYKHENSSIQSTERQENRLYNRMIEKDPELWDGFEEPIRQPNSKKGNQTDKLSSVYRFLDSKIGQVWDNVRSEISKKFDGRTIAGAHILYDHILKQIRYEENDIHFEYAEYYVDKNGILCKKIPSWKRRLMNHKYERISYEEFNKAIEWLGQRAIISQGSHFYFAIPSREIVFDYNYGGIRICFRSGNEKLYKWNFGWNPISFRQENELKGKDLEFFNSLGEPIKKILIVNR